MKTPLNTHQIFYAKDFYQHSGDIIADMRKVCKLDNPSWDFSSPKQILKFMRKQYELWLENSPEISRDKNGDNKVAWEDDPIKAEIWHILIAYSCYIPMTNIRGFIKGLPRYDVLKPQYNVSIYHFMDEVFEGCSTREECTNRVKEILNMSNTEIMDIIADRLMQDFKFNRAAKVLEYFGENVSAEQLDDELWTGYSELVGYNLNEDGSIVEHYLHQNTPHFSIAISPKFANNCTMDIDVELVPYRCSVVSDEVITPENFREQYLKCCDKIMEMSQDKFEKIAELCSTVFNEESEQFQKYTWESPNHLMNSKDVAETAHDVLHHYIDEKWTDGGCCYDNFKKLNDYGCLGVRTGCFGSTIWKESDGKMRVEVEFHTLYESGCYDHSLYNYEGLRLVDSPKY